MRHPRPMDVGRAIATVNEGQESRGSVSGTSALSAAERIFVDVFIGNGGQGTGAAIAAGLPEASASVAACRMLCKRRVADAILARCATFLQTAIPVALKALLDIAGDETALRKDRIKAATSILEHGGMAAPKGGVQVNVGLQVNGQEAQTIIGSVWNARAARLSDIPTAMPDTIDAELHDIERLAIEPPADPPGGGQLQGPGAGTCPVPVSPSTTSPISDVSRLSVPNLPPNVLDAFKAAFDDDSQGEDDGSDED